MQREQELKIGQTLIVYLTFTGHPSCVYSKVVQRSSTHPFPFPPGFLEVSFSVVLDVILAQLENIQKTIMDGILQVV